MPAVCIYALCTCCIDEGLEAVGRDERVGQLSEVEFEAACDDVDVCPLGVIEVKFVVCSVCE